jgi:hypothetical protein
MSDKESIDILALFSVSNGSEFIFAESEIFLFRAISRISKKKTRFRCILKGQ